jgi:hypothetical protein
MPGSGRIVRCAIIGISAAAFGWSACSLRDLTQYVYAGPIAPSDAGSDDSSEDSEIDVAIDPSVEALPEAPADSQDQASGDATGCVSPLAKADFGFSEVSADHLPESIEGWNTLTCGGVWAAKCPSGYVRTSCKIDPYLGTHGGCPDCYMAGFTCQCLHAGDSGADPSNPCTLMPQQGCSSDTACDLVPGDRWGNTACRAVSKPGKEVDRCQTVEECAAGYRCMASAPGVCMKYCSSDADCTSPGGLCMMLRVTVGGYTVPGVFVCSQNCDPITSSGCPSGALRCTVDRSNDGRTYTVCEGAGSGAQNAACTKARDCASGYQCYNHGAGSQCSRICLNDSDCASESGTTCHPTTIGWPLADKTYSACY